jgi:hypothetical protein
VEKMFHQLGGHAMKAYKSSLEKFNLLHWILEPYLIKQLGNSKRGRPKRSSLNTSTSFLCH